MSENPSSDPIDTALLRTEGADAALTEDRAARIPLEDADQDAEGTGSGTEDPELDPEGPVPGLGDVDPDAAGTPDSPDPEDEIAFGDAPSTEPGASGPPGTGVEGADQALADDFADPAENVADDRAPLRDVFGTEDTAAAEQENREGDETRLDTDQPSQGFAPLDEG